MTQANQQPTRTPLYNKHKQLGAYMVNFHNWQMPLHYGSQLKEHASVRENCGVFDISHMGIVLISGPEAKNFLRYLLANDINKCEVNKALYTCMLNHNGGILDDLIVYQLGVCEYRLVINSGCITKDISWIRQQLESYSNIIRQEDSMVRVALECDIAALAVQGPCAQQILSKLIDPEKLGVISLLKPFHMVNNKAWSISRTGYTGEDGFEIFLPKEQVVAAWDGLLEQGANPCGLGARDTLRLEAGLNLYGNDMTLETTPLCTNLSWSVSWEDKDRDFIGKGALEGYLSHGITDKLVGLYLNDRGVLREGQILYHRSEACGLVTSGGFSPVLNKSIGFVRIEKEHLRIFNDNLSNDFSVEIRGKMLGVTLVKLPFVRKGKSVVSNLFADVLSGASG